MDHRSLFFSRAPRSSEYIVLEKCDRVKGGNFGCGAGATGVTTVGSDGMKRVSSSRVSRSITVSVINIIGDESKL